MVYYVDTSALGKLLFDEEQCLYLRRWWQKHCSQAVSSDLARTEMLRTVRRVSPDKLASANALLAALDTINLDQEHYSQAGMTEPIQLRSLDALHLTAALLFRPELDGLVTYDKRLAEAAALVGVTVIAPTG